MTEVDMLEFRTGIRTVPRAVNPYRSLNQLAEPSRCPPPTEVSFLPEVGVVSFAWIALGLRSGRYRTHSSREPTGRRPSWSGPIIVRKGARDLGMDCSS